MKAYIAMLRGINVNGKNMIKMSALAAALEGLGFVEIRTYLQSGNVLFKCTGEQADTLAKIIADRIFKVFGFQLFVIVLEGKTLQLIRDQNPFIERIGVDSTKLHVTFLEHTPDRPLEAFIEKDKYQPDEWHWVDKVIYVCCPGGYGTTKLTNNFFENKLKNTATTRNWNTVNKLVELSLV